MKRKALLIGGTGTISMAITKLLAQLGCCVARKPRHVCVACAITSCMRSGLATVMLLGSHTVSQSILCENRSLKIYNMKATKRSNEHGV